MFVRCSLLLAVVSTAVAAGTVCFEDVAEQAGLRFVLDNAASAKKHMIETMAGGVAVFDYDNDGRPDIFFTNGASVPDLVKSEPKYFNRLFRNEGGIKFRDVTGEAGLGGSGYAMGAAAADFDNDGDVDLFVAGVYHNLLYRNLGNGKFEDITAKAGIKSSEWSVAAGFFDADNDGLLDLVVVNYGTWNAQTERFCGDATRELRVYCHPKYYEPRPNQLYRNKGDGTFEDISAGSGVAASRGRAMGVAFADYDRDGLVDFFVTNDNLPNFLFHNKGGGKFEEVGLLSGTALADTGKPVASMGTDFRDYDNDGWPDIVVLALTGETFPVFHNEKKGNFRDTTYATGIAGLSTRRGGWGPVFADFDNDGWKDLFTSNAHVNDLVERFEATTFKQANTVFRNAGTGKFELADCPALAAKSRAHRGNAAADFDGDGKLDMVVTALNEPVELWRNTTATSGHWINLRLRGTKSNRDGLGAVIRIGDQVNEVSPNAGYSSVSLSGTHFGVGPGQTIPRIEIRWPSGKTQVLTEVRADQVLTVTEE